VPKHLSENQLEFMLYIRAF